MKQTTYHFIGIGGIGMSALARILLEKGMQVSGSDIHSSARVEQLQKMGATIFIGHEEKNIRPSQIVIYSSAVSHDNVELKRAKELGCILWHRADLLRWLARNQKSLVVVGSHGKTTTTALLSHVLFVAGKNPSYVFGGHSPSFDSNGHAGYGEYFALEGDESDGSLLKTDPFGAIITNVDNDHLDFWQSRQALCHAYVSFMLKVKEKDFLFWCADDIFLQSIKPRGKSYGYSTHADIQIKNVRLLNYRTKFDLYTKTNAYKDIDLGILGEHNVLNASAVFSLAIALGIPESDIRLSFTSFKGVNRRLEKKGLCKGADIYDDYAHHPTEIVATLKTLKAMAKDKKLCAIFQPHRYSRMKTIMGDFAKAFEFADELIVTDIYSAGEAPLEGIDIPSIMKVILPKESQKVNYVRRGDLEQYIKTSASANNIFVTLGAGDISQLSEALVQ